MKYFIVLIFLVLFSCGGGGGSNNAANQSASTSMSGASSGSSSSSSSSSSSASNPSSSQSSLSSSNNIFTLDLLEVNLNSSDNIANLSLGNQTSNIEYKKKNSKSLNKKIKDFFKLIVPEIFAQSTTPNLKPINIENWQTITKEFSNGVLTDINPVVRAYEVSESNYEGSYVFRTKNKYICHYKNPDSQTIKISTSKFNFVNPSNDPYSGGRLYKITDDNGDEIETYDHNDENEVYSDEALSCAKNEIFTFCDTTNLPINIMKSAPADKSGSFFAQIEYAFELEEFEESCTPKLTSQIFLISDQKIYPLGNENGSSRRLRIFDPNFYDQPGGMILMPNGPFNASSNIIAIDSTIEGWMVSSYEIIESAVPSENGTLRITQLNPPNIEFLTDPGYVLFDGENLYLNSADLSSVSFYFANPTEEGFTIVRPDVVTNGDFLPERKLYSGVTEWLGGDDLDCTNATGSDAGNMTQNSICNRIWHLGRNWNNYVANSKMAFGGADIRFVLDKKNELLIFSDGWAHSFVPQTKTFTKKVLDFPPTNLKRTAKLVDQANNSFVGFKAAAIATDCPTDSSASLSHLPKADGTTFIESCMVWPKLGNYGGNRILGRWENYIIGNNGAWDPETLIFTGDLSALPLRPGPAVNENFVTDLNNTLHFSYVDNFLFWVNKSKNIYLRYDLSNHTYRSIDLDDFGYIGDDFRITKDSAYIEVVNSANSNKEYVKLNFEDGTSEFLGTISEGLRTVVDIRPLNVQD